MRKLFIVTILLALMLGACKSSRKSVEQPYTPSEPVVEKPSARTLADDYKAMTGAYRSWTDMTVPVKVSARAPKKLSLSGTLTMAYGKSLSLSMKMLFVEAGTLYADRDSVIIVSKPLGVYYAESLKRFTAAVGLTLDDLQSLLLGQAFAPGKGTASAGELSQFSLERAADITEPELYGFTITPKRKVAGADWHYTAIAPVDPSAATPQIFALEVSAGANKVECTFAQSEKSPAGIIAAQMQIEGTVKKHKIDATIATTPSRAQWNTGKVPARPSIPKGARRVTTEQIFKMLKGL